MPFNRKEDVVWTSGLWSQSMVMLEGFKWGSRKIFAQCKAGALPRNGAQLMDNDDNNNDDNDNAAFWRPIQYHCIINEAAS